MYRPLSPSGANDPATATSVGERPAVLGKVLGMLGFAFLFTAGGAVIGANSAQVRLSSRLSGALPH